MSGPKLRILLICSPHLFGESLETLLRAQADIEVLGPWGLEEPKVCERLVEVQPAMVVIADQNLQSHTAAKLTQSILEQYPDLSVIRTGMSENICRIFSTHTLPARGASLLETIRNNSREKP